MALESTPYASQNSPKTSVLLATLKTTSANTFLAKRKKLSATTGPVLTQCKARCQRLRMTPTRNAFMRDQTGALYIFGIRTRANRSVC